MKRVKLYKALELNLINENIISLVGGGGKTTAISTLAKELKELGYKVLIATSTGIFVPNPWEYDNLFLGSIPPDFQAGKETITYFAEAREGIKLKTKDISLIDEMIERNIFDFILMEADGSKRKPIKAPADHEPNISKNTNLSIGVIGLDSIGLPIDEDHVHRSELLKGIIQEDIVTKKGIYNLVKAEKGLFKNSRGRRILILNKADNPFKIQIGKDIRKLLEGEDLSVIIGDMILGNYY